MIAPLLFVLLSVTAAQPQKETPPGKLCIGDAPCIGTEGGRARVDAAETPRRYVWISDDRALVALGSVVSGATEVTVGEGSSRTLRINPPVRGSVSFDLAGRDGRWRWAAVNPPPAIRLIHPACADCVLSAEATGYRRFEKALREVTDVALQPWPHIRGKVADRATGAPLPGATITVSGVLVAKAEANGAFDAAVEGDWPRAVEIGYPGRATRRVNLPQVPGDTDLEEIILSKGGALHVVFDPPIPQKLTWDLREPMNFDVLREGRIDGAASEVSIDGITEGKHAFNIRGGGPLQQFSTIVEISEGSVTEAKIAVEPTTVRFEVVRGDAPLPRRTLHLLMFSRWRDELSLDEEGRAVGEMWQRGHVAAMLGGASAVGFSARRDIDSNDVTWRIEVPDRSVMAHVVDAATGAPISNADVTFEVHHRDSNLMVSAKTDAAGQALFDLVHEGTHEMKVRHRDYLESRRVVTVAEASGTYPQEIRLHSRDEGRPLTVVDERGAPLPDALVILGDRNGLREIAFTGLDGRCAVPLGRDDHGTIFVIPRSGSFAFNRIPPQRGEDASIEMRVRAGTAVIEVEARDPAGKPLPHVLVIPRVNGLMFAPQLVDAFMRMQGMSLMTDANGRARLTGMPPGVYELWAVAGQDQLRALRSPSPPPPAASLEVISGRYEVTLGFTANRAASP